MESRVKKNRRLTNGYFLFSADVVSPAESKWEDFDGYSVDTFFLAKNLRNLLKFDLPGDGENRRKAF